MNANREISKQRKERKQIVWQRAKSSKYRRKEIYKLELNGFIIKERNSKKEGAVTWTVREIRGPAASI
jgi:hypothetical protein